MAAAGSRGKGRASAEPSCTYYHYYTISPLSAAGEGGRRETGSAPEPRTGCAPAPGRPLPGAAGSGIILVIATSVRPRRGPGRACVVQPWREVLAYTPFPATAAREGCGSRAPSWRTGGESPARP